VPQLVAALATEYEAPSEELEKDDTELLETLQSGKLIV
jgi:hypothetical protein